MSTAMPMDQMDRADLYLRRGNTWTWRQIRRFTQKQNADTGRRLAQLIADDPEVTLCGHHVREYCVACLMCSRCDGCDC